MRRWRRAYGEDAWEIFDALDHDDWMVVESIIQSVESRTRPTSPPDPAEVFERRARRFGVVVKLDHAAGVLTVVQIGRAEDYEDYEEDDDGTLLGRPKRHSDPN